MPIYEFHCEQCGKDSEIRLSSSKWKGTPCPECGSKKLVKKLSVFAAGGSKESAAAPACDGNPASCCGCPHRYIH